MGYWRQRTYQCGHPWGLGPQVTRLFDADVNANVPPHIAYQAAVETWDVKLPPSSEGLKLMNTFLRNRKKLTRRN
jgi:hypothetical protein